MHHRRGESAAGAGVGRELGSQSAGDQGSDGTGQSRTDHQGPGSPGLTRSGVPSGDAGAPAPDHPGSALRACGAYGLGSARQWRRAARRRQPSSRAPRVAVGQERHAALVLAVLADLARGDAQRVQRTQEARGSARATTAPGPARASRCGARHPARGGSRFGRRRSPRSCGRRRAPARPARPTAGWTPGARRPARSPSCPAPSSRATVSSGSSASRVGGMPSKLSIPPSCQPVTPRPCRALTRNQRPNTVPEGHHQHPVLGDQPGHDAVQQRRGAGRRDQPDRQQREQGRLAEHDEHRERRATARAAAGPRPRWPSPHRR